MDKWRVLVVERERGWGGDEWYRYFDTEPEALEFIRETNAKNTAPHAPDYYIVAQGPPKKVYVGKHQKL